MTAAVRSLVRRVLGRERKRPRSARGVLRVVRREVELPAASIVLARLSPAPVAFLRERLGRLFAIDATTLFLQIDRASRPFDVVLTPHAGTRLVATGQKFRVETETEEPAPDGAYLVERQYRNLGFYEVPPDERALIVLEIHGGSGRTYLVDYPPYVRHATVVVDGRPLAQEVALPARGQLRYHVG
jgi:hypothetical protein